VQVPQCEIAVVKLTVGERAVDHTLDEAFQVRVVRVGQRSRRGLDAIG
jgi:hypothetical protein